MKKTVYFIILMKIQKMKMFYMKIENIRSLFIPHLLNKKKNIDCSSALYSIKAPFKLLHADVADIHFLKNQHQTQFMFYLQLIYSLPNYILIELEKELQYQKNLKYLIDIDPKREKINDEK